MSIPRIERTEDPDTALLYALRGHQAALWTAMPAIVRAVNLTAMTVQAQPTIQARVRAPDQSYSWVDMPVCVDCPIMFPGGGGFTLTFPIAVDDECLLIFANRCIDNWWAYGGLQKQTELRMHDLSDGFALVGVRSTPRVLEDVSSSAVELRSDNNTSKIRMTSGGAVSVLAPGGFSVVSPTFTHNGKNVGETHTHGGVDTGSGTSGPPT
mgnify:CR=1 FL=1